MCANKRLLTVLGGMIISFILLLHPTIAAPTQQGQDIAVLETPAEGDVVQGQVQIVGSADHPAFEFYVLDVAPAGTESWQFLSDGSTAVLNGVLGSWNTANLPDGNYSIRLRVVRVDGNYSETFLRQVTVANTAAIPTATPSPTVTAVGTESLPDLPEIPTFTPIPPTETPRVMIDQPIVETPTPRPTETPTVVPLEDPEEQTSLIPKVTGFAVTPLWDACLYGAGVMLSIFLFFGFLSALRYVILGFMERRRG